MRNPRKKEGFDIGLKNVATYISEGKRSGSIRGKHLKWKHWILWIWGAKRGQMVRISLGRGTNKIDRNTNCELIWNPILFSCHKFSSKISKIHKILVLQIYNSSKHKCKRISKENPKLKSGQISLKLLNKSSFHFCCDGERSAKRSSSVCQGPHLQVTSQHWTGDHVLKTGMYEKKNLAMEMTTMCRLDRWDSSMWLSIRSRAIAGENFLHKVISSQRLKPFIHRPYLTRKCHHFKTGLRTSG